MLAKIAVGHMKTQEKILKSALQLFVKSGFEGTSISQIAKKAKINQSLIYHHFGNKEKLWKEVKTHLLQKFYSEEELVIDVRKGLKHYLREIIMKRFEFYDKNPNVIRIAAWQKLEAKSLQGGNALSPDNWKKDLIALQELGEIKKDLDPEMMILMIKSLVSGLFSEITVNWKKDSTQKRKYLELIIDFLFNSLKV